MARCQRAREAAGSDSGSSGAVAERSLQATAASELAATALSHPDTPQSSSNIVTPGERRDERRRHTIAMSLHTDEGDIVPLYMDMHNIDGGVSGDDVASAHMADLQTQDKYEVKYLRYWVDEQQGKVFCLVEAPSADAAATVHKEAHGLLADEIFQVQEGT